AVIAAIKADDYDANSSLGKAKKIITDSLANGGLGIDLADLDVIDYRTPQFATYYNKYTLQSAVDNNFYSRILGDEGNENEVLYYFLKIYDDLNSTKFAPDNIADLADAGVRADIEEAFKMAYSNPLFTGNTQLRNYVYGLDKESLYLETKDGPN